MLIGSYYLCNILSAGLYGAFNNVQIPINYMVQ